MGFRRKKIQLENLDIDYKNAALLSNYVDSSNKILGRRQTGLSAKKQRDLQKAIKRARAIGLMAY